MATTLDIQSRLSIFIPLYYAVWADAVLTPSEVKVVEDMIHTQSWLTDEERLRLIEAIHPQNPPSTDTLKLWLEHIKALQPKQDATLFALGIQLANRGGFFFNGEATQLEKAFLQVEQKLGWISRELIYNFVPELRQSVTQQQQTVASFRIEQLQNILDGEHATLIKQVKTFLSDPEFAYLDTDNLTERREKVLHWCKLLARQGYGALAYPKEFGGKADMAAYFTVMETLSYHDLSMVVKFGVQFGLWGMSVYFLGTEKHHRQYLSKIGTLELPGCFAMTETGHGSNVRGIETTATYQHAKRSFIIHTPHEIAQKEYIGNAALHGRMATVFAKMIIDGKDYGVAAFVVPLRDEKGNTLPGVTITDCGRKMGLNGVDNGKISFNQVEIPYDNLLDRFAGVDEEGKFTSPIASDNRRFFTMLGTLVGGRIGIPRSALSASKSALSIAIQYGDQRRQFGPEGAAEVPILNYRTHQRRLIPLLANAYALHFSLQYLTQRFVNRTEEEMQEIEALAAGLKAFATWNNTHTLQTARECCGGKGYLSENRIDDLKNDSDIYTTFEGDNTVLLQLVAKSRLTEFKQEFSNMNAFGILNYVANQAKTTITEMNPFAVRNTEDEHLLDFDFHLSAFKYRERDILTSAAKRLKRHLDSGMDSFDAFNVCQHHLVEAGMAHIERVVLEQFQQEVEKTKDEGCKKILQELCQLFAINLLDQHKGWYLENGYMEGVKTKAIRKTLNQLCWDVRQQAVPLTQAFGIPDSLLSAPIVVK
ncbi:MAG: acyl-CoA dehydrogenase [Cyclobacteriaceae bacterium]|nr:acyl-CoA dehydrogenase [Cyclobacteriaceae bacterium]